MAHKFVFIGSNITCRLYKLTPSDQVQITLQMTVSLSDFVYRFLAGPPLMGGAKKFCHPDPNPLPAALLRIKEDIFYWLLTTQL
jgi:hypothetical protein